MTTPYAAAESAEQEATHAEPDQAENAQADGENEQPLWELLPAGPLRENLLNLPANLRAVTRLVNHHGWYSSRYMHRSISEIIKSQCGEPQATFADFRRQGRRDLYVVATNLSRRRVEVFSAETTPDVAVADALLLSQSIPLYFAAPRFDGRSLGAGDTYTDGGVLDNYPLQLFDEPRHVAQREHFVDGVNRETLGCRFYTPDHCQEHADIGTLIDYAVNLFFTMNAAEDIAYAANPTAQARTVEISNCCVASTDFDLEPSPDDARYAALVAAGREAMQAYLEAYQR